MATINMDDELSEPPDIERKQVIFRDAYNSAAIVDGGVHLFPRIERNGTSTIGYAKGYFNAAGNIVIVHKNNGPLIDHNGFESLEDPRVTKLDGKFHLTCTAYDGMNARVAHTESHDLRRWENWKVVSPNLKTKKNEI